MFSKDAVAASLPSLNVFSEPVAFVITERAYAFKSLEIVTGASSLFNT